MLYHRGESRFPCRWEKNLIYEANIANPPTAEVISKSFKSPTEVIFIRDKPQNLLICDSLGIGKFYLSRGKVCHPVIKEIERPFKEALIYQRKQVWIVILNLEGNNATTIEYEFKEPTGISFLPGLDVVAVCDSAERTMVLLAKNGDGAVAINLPSEITPVHVSFFRGFGNDVFLASNTNVLYPMKVTLDNCGHVSRNSSAELEQIAGHRPQYIPFTVTKTDQPPRLS